MTRDHGLRFRAHLSKLVACLEDADSGVRETAKSTVIELFQYVVTIPPPYFAYSANDRQEMYLRRRSQI